MAPVVVIKNYVAAAQVKPGELPLSDDCLLFIFRLSRRPQDWLRFAQVSKQFDRVASHNHVWRQTYKDMTARFEIDPKQSVHVEKYCWQKPENHPAKPCRVRKHFSNLRRVDLKRRFRNLKQRCLPRLRQRLKRQVEHARFRVTILQQQMNASQGRAEILRAEIRRSELHHRRMQAQLAQMQRTIRACF